MTNKIVSKSKLLELQTTIVKLGNEFTPGRIISQRVLYQIEDRVVDVVKAWNSLNPNGSGSCNNSPTPTPLSSISSSKLIALQSSINLLADYLSPGREINVEALELFVQNVCKSWISLGN